VALGLNLYYEQTQSQDRSFDTEDYGFSTSFGFPASENGRFGLSYSIDQREIDFGTQAGEFLADHHRRCGARMTSAVGLRYSFDNRTTGLNPNAGVFFNLDGVAGLGGDAEYVRVVGTAIAERAILREEVTLRASFEGGALSSTGNSHYNDRFFLNSRQMRGFDTFGLGPRDTTAPNNDALGGNYFAVARFEAAFPLGLPEEYGISGGVFYDVGSVWGLDNTAGFGGPVDDSLHWRSAIGFSVFWDTALGPLRFNFSHALETQPYDLTRNFDFTVETRF
jgi:outer membrane protein insertion porin family